VGKVKTVSQMLAISLILLLQALAAYSLVSAASVSSIATPPFG
jgi:phosphatidylglycerophosphate synthase